MKKYFLKKIFIIFIISFCISTQTQAFSLSDIQIPASSLMVSVGDSISSGWNFVTSYLGDVISNVFNNIEENNESPTVVNNIDPNIIDKVIIPSPTTTETNNEIVAKYFIGPKGDKGDNGSKGDKGDKGERGSNTDTSSLVSKDMFYGQIDRVFDSVNKKDRELNNDIDALALSNTGDETTSSIKIKLGIANTSTDGYLTSTDWNVFNNKVSSPIIIVNTSNIFGPNAGGGVSTVVNSNFFGQNAGFEATSAENSNLLGFQSGYQATNVNNSNFLGNQSGKYAVSASYSNFLGTGAGSSATNASYSNFLGSFAGLSATNASNSNFLGRGAGNSATNASYSNLLGFQAGKFYIGNNIGSNNIIIGTNISLPDATTNAINLGGVLFGTGSYSTTTGNPSITPTSTGSIGIGVVTPTARLQLPAGTAAAGTAPLKLTPGTNLSTTEDGAIEYNGSHLYFTTTNGGNRHQLDQQLSLNSNESFILGGGASVQNSNFIGIGAGSSATNVFRSNFFGYYTGQSAVNAYHSNFLGREAGSSATAANNSNFLGQYAGYFASAASYSNLFGFQAGKFYTGNNIGSNNIIIGTNISLPNTQANSINIGGVLFGTGSYATTTGNPSITAVATGKIGIGVVTPTARLQLPAGAATVNRAPLKFTSGTNLTTTEAGAIEYDGTHLYFTATDGGTRYQLDQQGAGSYTLPTASGSTLGGIKVGTGLAMDGSGVLSATGGGSASLDINNSFILGGGYSGATANYSNFIGSNAGQSATSASYSNFLGTSAGYQATSASYSNFLGASAGQSATSASYSNFLGTNAGFFATSASYSNFLGSSAGDSAINANQSNFLGQSAGYHATSAQYSNFLGNFAGSSATNASNSNFLGQSAGSSATSASYSNFLGNYAGQLASLASHSNFLGRFSGESAINASNSNFIGNGTGRSATNASNSNFLGTAAGNSATNASYSNLFGYRVGYEYNTGINIGSNNIIIGTNISLPNATANAINLGGILFGTGTYSDTAATNPSITAVTSGKIGIAKVTPAYTLDVGNSSVSGIVAQFTNSTGYCTINPTTTSLSCSSDINLKKNIYTLEDQEWILNTIPTQTSTLSKLLSLTPVTYNWNTEEDTDPKHTGFIAQEMEQVFPDLVSTDPTTSLKSISYANLTPYIVKAIQEMNLQITTIEDLTKENTIRESIIAWFGDATNGITRIFTKTLSTEGIEMKDSTTGEFYCVVISNGEFDKIKGKCGEPVVDSIEEAIEEIPTTLPEEEIIPNVDTDIILPKEETDIVENNEIDVIPSVNPTLSPTIISTPTLVPQINVAE